jgi:hypothetical protein
LRLRRTGLSFMGIFNLFHRLTCFLALRQGLSYRCFPLTG